MFKTTVFAAALTALALPALAGAGLERSLGVTPGLYSDAQLVRLATLGEQDHATRAMILGNPEGPAATLVSMSTKGEGTKGGDGPKVWVSIKRVTH